MDFSSLMAKEIAKARKTTTTAPVSSDQPTPPKYVKKSELEARRLAAYNADKAAAEAERERIAETKRKREAEEAEEHRVREEKRRRLVEETRRNREEREAAEEREWRKRVGLPELGSKNNPATPKDGDGDDDKAAHHVTDEEAVRQLRELGEPARLFGESSATRIKRLRRLSRKVTAGPIPTTLEPVEEAAMKVSGAVPKDKEGRAFLYRQLASYFIMVLSEYQRAMEAEVRDTAASRTAYSAMEQCRENMKPLFRKFEKDDLESDVLETVVEIVKAAQERRYVDANDGYLRLSIGKAAWPIGVTMVGIHERSAREKLHGGERGHVMGNEVTRKFLQSIKRCLTFAQVRWPPEDIRQLMG